MDKGHSGDSEWPFCCSTGAELPSSLIVVVLEIEQVEEVADGRHVLRNVGIAIVGNGIGKIVAAAVAQCALELPVAFHELDEGGVLGIRLIDIVSLPL